MAHVFSPLPVDDDFWRLLLDLRSLIDAGLVAEIRRPGEPSRYSLSAAGHELAAQSAAPSEAGLEPKARPHVVRDPEPDRPEPCPVCGAREDFDGGGRCNACHVPWRPEM